jgi:carboxymethylenebutenolidase
MAIGQGFFVDTAIFRYRSGYHEINAFLAVPSVAAPMPAILLAHDVYGLDEHMQDLAVRFAREGYAVLIPDFYTTKGGPASASGSLIDSRTLRRQTPDLMAVTDIKNGLALFKKEDYVDANRVAVVGFGFGGTIALLSAAQVSGLAAAVNFYGDVVYPRELISRTKPNSPLDLMGLIKCPLLSFYGAPDNIISSQEVSQLERTLRARGKVFELKTYPRVPNGFFNNSRPEYRAEAARDAFARTFNFLDRYLKG